MATASVADIVDAVAVLIPDVAVHFGAEHLPTNNAPPRVVFVPSRDSFTGAQRNGAFTPAGKRSFGTREAGCDVHVWGAGDVDSVSITKDQRATEALLNRVLIAIHKVAGGAYTKRGVEWPMASVSHLGRECILAVTFSLPVLERDEDSDSTTAVITVFGNPEMTGILDLPDPAVDPTGSPAP